MKFGIMTRNPEAWSSSQVREALSRHGIAYECFTFPRLIARLAYKPYFKVNNISVIEDLDALIIRPIGRGSLEELVFRMDMLHKMERQGFYMVNPPGAIEHCVDKYDILALLEDVGVPVPRTLATESVNEAIKAFNELGGDVVVKPIFGSRGQGATRVNDIDIADTIFKAITFHHGVIYMQEFIEHGHTDIRAFVLGNQVIASMRRVATGWKTNYSRGAKPAPTEISDDFKELAVKAAKAVGCKVAGVDILEGPDGPRIVDVNSQPGWKGLQAVSKVNIAEEIVKFVVQEIKK
ncbi:MAG: RimK family alpha-L-glutamate ligase [Candidatus Bathyarchaeota archaeon]|nr:RimK family alpha-L-glutamate ligase [Candidatus Bathyarchaeota archaeon]MDD4325260.1 RimK family alpha-L-glutamate ligase [Candidatus Bathyarchaeota archaeon]MDI9576879.1 RimK family alpha-L-glutamate ligase [Thermoproteota archaeon]MDT8782102.1 RimK family alpha-L-glutamate ligase [Candidatus Bathyarchaeota archaeon]NLD66249.1 RimK family alpha-L-glutamate ligase [Thermoproteota archaeon]